MSDPRKLSADYSKALDKFTGLLDGRLRTHLNSCVNCNLCADSCHYYLSTGDAKYIPRRKANLLSSIYRRYRTLAGRMIPGWIGARDLTDQTIDEMVDLLFGACTMCGRCVAHCSIGVDIPLLVRTGRTILAEMGKVPQGLQSTVNAAVNTGNNMAIPREELIDTLVWLEEDLRMEVKNETAAIPLDKHKTKFLYTLNPREPKFFPLSISAMAKIYFAARESWTISTQVYDVTNYAYFSGDNEKAGVLTKRLHDETIALGAETLVLAECGHGYRAMRWEGPRWLKQPYPFKVVSVIEVLSEYIKDGRIRLDPKKIDAPVTLHDPCNLVRNGGVIDEQRFVLKNACSNFIEMNPNRENNYCCGGGGGQLAMGEYKARRIGAGKIKAEQIRKTGAKIVATPCHNCIDQLSELNQEYKLGVEVKTVAEIVADALVLD
ncbi:MAG: (Fe-S)-binding protein [Bacteroidota bacterium]